MRLPLPFRRENSSVAAKERAEFVERMMSEGLRRLSQLMTEAAEAIEKRRLERNGFHPPGKFLERTNKKR